MYLPTRTVMDDPYKMLPHLERLVQHSVAQRRAGLVPALFASGVRYRKDPQERWLTALETYRQGYGDCDQLAVWRAADLRLEGKPARVVIKLVRPNLYHAQISVDGKELYDPSRVLGMRGAA